MKLTACKHPNPIPRDRIRKSPSITNLVSRVNESMMWA